MLAATVNAAVATLQIYAATGLAFATAFVLVGVRRVDPVATSAGWGFRALIFPGAAALWPLLAWRWLSAGRRAR